MQNWQEDCLTRTLTFLHDRKLARYFASDEGRNVENAREDLFQKNENNRLIKNRNISELRGKSAVVLRTGGTLLGFTREEKPIDSLTLVEVASVLGYMDHSSVIYQEWKHFSWALAEIKKARSESYNLEESYCSQY